MAEFPPGRESLRAVLNAATALVREDDAALDAYAKELSEVAWLIEQVRTELR